MSPPSALIGHYEEEFRILAANIAEKANVSSDHNSNNRNISSNLDTNLDSDLRAASLILDQMEVEALAFDPITRPTALSRVYALRKDLERIEDEIRKSRYEIDSLPPTIPSLAINRVLDDEFSKEMHLDGIGGVGRRHYAFRRDDDLEPGNGFGLPSLPSSSSSASASAYSTSNAHNPHARLLADYDHMEKTEDRMDRTQRLAAEAEQIGAAVLSDLKRQREQIVRATRTLHETENEIDSSNKLLRSMIRRVMASRLISMAMILVLCVTVLLVVYFKFIK